jgi:MFS-type transporter involved in bile tolerance (Atg22 family)
MLHDIERRCRLKLMDHDPTIMDEEARRLRFWRSATWIAILVACAIFWVAAGAVVINGIFLTGQ